MSMDKPVSPQTTPEGVRGPAMSSRFAQAVLRAHDRNEHWSMLTLLEQELAYAELVEALESVLSHLPQGVISHTIWEDDDGTVIYYDWYMKARAVLAKIAIKEGKHEAKNDKG